MPVLDGGTSVELGAGAPATGVSSRPESSTAAATVPITSSRTAAAAPTTSSTLWRRLRANRRSSSAADRIGTSISSGPATGWPSRSAVRLSKRWWSTRRPASKVPSAEWLANTQPPGTAAMVPWMREQAGSEITIRSRAAGPR